MTLLELHKVTKRYERWPQSVTVLEDVSLELERGDFIAVWGPRGGGKTTLLKLAAGIEAPDAGAVVFDGRDLATLSRGERSRLLHERIAWVPRGGPASEGMAVVDWVAFPLLGRHAPRHARRIAVEALEQVGLEDVRAECWHQLSDGARTLVAIAHGIVRDPALLLVDDATASLDLVERERTLGLLRGGAGGRTRGVIVTLPDLPTSLPSHQVRSLSGGRLVAPVDPFAGSQVIGFPSAPRSGSA